MKLQVLLGVSMCALPFHVHAQDRPRGDQPKRPILERFREERQIEPEVDVKIRRMGDHEGDMFAFLDKDKDGVISSEEFHAFPRMAKLPLEQRELLFARLDSDGDGKITPEEIKKMRRPIEGDGDMFAMLDKDEDGAISEEEFAASPRIENLSEEERKKIFSRMDADGDGKVTPEEMRKMRQEAHERQLHEFRELDTDNSGGLSFEELSKGKFFSQLPEEKRKQIFERMDTNADGQITPEDRPNGPRAKPEGRPNVEVRPMHERLERLKNRENTQ